MSMQAPQTGSPTPSNTQKFADLCNTVTALGEQFGKGKDAQIRFALAVTEASYLGVADLDENKHGVGRDDALVLTETYFKSRSKNTMFDAKADNIRKALSWTKTYIKTGQWSGGGSQEPLQSIDRLMNIRQTLRKDPMNNNKLEDANGVFLRFCRTLLKNNAVPDDATLRGLCFKKGREQPTAEDIIEALAKQLDNLYAGKAVHKTVQDNSSEIDRARKALRQRLKHIAIERGKQNNPVPEPQAEGEAPTQEQQAAADGTEAALSVLAENAELGVVTT